MQATERILAVYPTLREVALAGSTGSKAMKQVALQLLSFAIKAAGESMGLHLIVFSLVCSFPGATRLKTECFLSTVFNRQS